MDYLVTQTIRISSKLKWVSLFEPFLTSLSSGKAGQGFDDKEE